MHYVSLHTHTTYSYGDGFGLPEEHMARIAELGMKAAAITDHGNVSGHVKWEQGAVKHGIKPIFGIEAYTAPGDMRETANMRKWHQTLLAMDTRGYQNLMKMITRSWSVNDFYRWPTVTGANLKENNAGIIATSGCLDGHLACTLLGGKGIEEGDYDAAVRVLKGYKRLLGDRYYLEVQRFPQLERARILNVQYAQWSKEFGIPLLATSDVHYPRPEQNEIQKILHASSRNTGTVAAAEAEWEYDILLTYPESDDQIVADLMATGLTRGDAQGAIAHTEEVADRCTVELPKMDRIRYPGTRADLDPVHAGFVRKTPLGASNFYGSGVDSVGSTEASTSRSVRRKRRLTPSA